MAEFGMRAADLRAVNSLTKYPSIPTYHALDPGNGGLLDDAIPFMGRVIGTEKVDGTNARIILLQDGNYPPERISAWRESSSSREPSRRSRSRKPPRGVRSAPGRPDARATPSRPAQDSFSLPHRPVALPPWRPMPGPAPAGGCTCS